MKGHRVDVLGVGISAINPQMAVAEIGRWIRENRREYVCITGVHGVMESQEDPSLAEIHNNSGMTTPDGMPLVWAAHHAGADWVERVYGPDLMLKVLERGREVGWSHYFYGSAPGVPERLVNRLKESLGDFQVAGTYSPPFRALTEEEEFQIAAAINTANPDIVWVGLSTPKQERWMASMRARLKAPVLIGVGAAFDMHAGDIRQAPTWMQNSGLEWVFRLVVEPRRLWRRYLRNNPRFVLAVLRERPRLLP